MNYNKVKHAFGLIFLLFFAWSGLMTIFPALSKLQQVCFESKSVSLMEENLKVTPPSKILKNPYGEEEIIVASTEKQADSAAPAEEEEEEEKGGIVWENYNISLKEAQRFFNEYFVMIYPLRRDFSTLNMAFKYQLGMRQPVEYNTAVLFSNKRMGMVTGKNPGIGLGYSTETIERFQRIQTACNEYGGNLLVVYKPTSEGYDDYVTVYKGMISDYNKSVEVRADLLRKEKIEVLELPKIFRENIPESESDKYWYRTDHHWNVAAGLFVAKNIANKLNHCFGANYDLDYFDPDAFVQYNFQESVIGSLGKILSTAYSEGKKEDFVVFMPPYETFFTLEYENDLPEVYLSKSTLLESNWLKPVEHGDFSIFLKMKKFSYDSYNTNAYHCFLGGDHSFLRIKNNKIKEGKKILWIKDSYANVVIPYMALLTKEIVVVDPRFRDYEEILQLIKNEKPDIVISMYFSGI